MYQFQLPKSKLIFLITSCILFFLSCKKENNTTAVITDPLAALNLPSSVLNYANQPLPLFLSAPNITQQINTPADNQVTDWGATLGRVLFYDKTLSINNSVACASCHKQENSFTDNVVLSKGFAGGNTGRHSMSLINAIYYPNGKFFWDERAATLEQQVLIPVQDAVEMGMRLDTLVNRLNRTTHYPYLFEKAFASKNITADRIAKSLAQFLRSMISYQSKFDLGFAMIPPNTNPGTTLFPNYTASENRGKAIFFSPQGTCASCHGTATFTAPRAENNGLEAVIADRGVGVVTNNPADNGKFKVPSIKNIELTAPYMHDGRFATLEQVIEHYNSGIQFNQNLAPQLRTTPQGNQPIRLNLTQQDRDDLLAFLKTLTDRSITSDVKFANPFK